MDAGSMFKRRGSLLAATAMLCVAAGTGVARAGDDSFFSDLAKADGDGGKATRGAAVTVEPSRADLAKADAALARPLPTTAPPHSLPPTTDTLLQKGLTSGDTTGAIAPRQALDRADWVPDHAVPAAAPAAANARTALPGRADAGPDDAVTVPTNPQPSKDPLDKASAVAAPAPETLPPRNAALKAALDKRGAETIRGAGAGERRKERAAIAFFYAARGFAPVWSADGKPLPAVASLLDRLGRAGEDALSLPAPVPTRLETGGSDDAVVASDIALTEAVVAYARQATGSRVDPKTISPLIGSLPTLADPAEMIDAVSAAGTEAGDKLAALNPSEPRYAALRSKLAELHGKQAAVAPVALPPGPTLRTGMRDKRVPTLRKRLGVPAGFGDDADDTLLDADLSDALAEYQRGKGLPASGALDKRTLATLNGAGNGAPAPSSARQEGTIIANMEMWRWMPRDLGGDRIEVNIPDYAVRVFHDGRAIDEHRVVVGKTDTPTPLFSNAMKYLIVNPYWNVPQSIIKKEMLPKGGGSLGYLQGRGYDVGWHNGMATVKQLPGPKNALGQIKFLFPNDYSVYLHDTPSKSLFAASRRAFSHGCVRVDKPFAFAETVLNEAVPEGTRSRWNQDKLEDMIGDKERYVNLAKPLPIHIEYFTASIEDGDRIKLREDIYGYAHAVATALGHDSEPAPAVKPKEPKEKPAAVAERPRRRTVAEAETTDPGMPSPPVSRGFWSSIFDPR